MVSTKAEGATTSKLLEIKNNLLTLLKPEYVPMFNVFSNIKDDLKKFHEYYQFLAPTREEQKQYPEQYIVLSDLTKKQKLKWFNDNNESIMPKCAHDINAGFDLRYLRKNTIKLEPHSCICIDLKVILEIPATIMVQLAFRSSLVKKGINIRGEIIDAEYVRNIITILQNDSEKAYIIEPNKKIVQAIFLPLVKIAQLVLVRNREELGITAKEIQGFEFMSKINVPVNMAEEEIVDKEKIISTYQSIFILPYD
ncbi:hypothetical protein G9A89_010562 [Geosiphon pyriformis]|nr:hypothetical protein G9A89_010562 [Geosiphon pyriformis]